MAAQSGLRGSIDTGPVHHELSLSGAWAERIYRLGVNSGTSFSSNIYNPVDVPNPNIADPGDPKVDDTTNSSVGVANTMSILDKRVQLTAGIRRQQVKQDSFNRTTGLKTSSYDSAAWSPAVALVVKPWTNVSVYANYIQGLEQGRIVSDFFANAGDVFPPYVSKQYEAGVKVDWGTLTTTVAAFQITRPNQIVVPGTPLNTLSQDGEQVNRGVEINTFGELADSVRLLGGVMFIDARQERTSNAADDGNKTPGIPNVQVNLGAEWDTPFLRGLTLNGRVIYSGDSYANNSNTLKLSDWTRVDLGARYTFGSPLNDKPVTLRFGINNLLDASYWQSSGGALFRGDPRTFRASLTYNF